MKNRVVGGSVELLALFQDVESARFELDVEAELFVSAGAFDLSEHSIDLVHQGHRRITELRACLIREWSPEQRVCHCTECGLVRDWKMVVTLCGREFLLQDLA